MLGENIKRVINPQVELKLRRIITSNSAYDTKDRRRPSWHKPGGGRDSYEARNGARAEAYSGPFLIKSEVEQHPRYATNRSSQMRHHTSHNSAHIRAQRAPAIEAEPADPQEDSADNNVGDVVRAVRQAMGVVVAVTLAEHEAIRERRGARGDVHGGAAGEVEPAELEHPAGGVPGPAGDGVVDDGGPDEDKDYAGEHAAAVGGGSNGEGGAGRVLLVDYGGVGREDHARDGCEHALVNSKE